MSLHFVPLKIKDVRKETNDCISVSFDISPAQKDQFFFQQGQNVTLKTIINNQEIRRSYSICTAPHENELRVAIKQAEGGLFSTYANANLQAGMEIEVLPPTGKFFTALNASHQKRYLAVAAGSGITPIISIIKSTLQTEPKSHFTLVFGNRNRSSIIFFEELEGLKNKYINRFQLIHVLSREQTDATINQGRIDSGKCVELSKRLVNFQQMDEIFICGPEEMIFTVNGWLTSNNIEKKKIHFELFTVPGQEKMGVSTVAKKTTNDLTPKSSVTIKQDGRSFSFDLAFDDLSILDAATKEGADLPYSCKGGVCSTCRAKLVEGEVEMDVCYALEPEEIEAGFILTCQSHPTTKTVVVDFDVK